MSALRTDGGPGASEATPHPSTPSQVTPRQNQQPRSSGPSDDDLSETPRRPRIHIDQDEDLSGLITSPLGQLSLRTRMTSPSQATTNRPHTSAGIASLPQMQRAYSSPGVDSSGRFISPLFSSPRRPSSPLSSGRRRSPLRSSFEEIYPSSYGGLNLEPNIPEHAELEISSPIMAEDGLGPLATISSYSNTFPRSRRRTTTATSPLHQSASAPSLQVRATSPHYSGSGSPSLTAARFAHETYPAYSYSSTSSMPSTPTSFRSRSPSISSLETIEDTPDAEEAAMHDDEEVRVRGDDTESTNEFRRKSLDLRSSALRSNKDRKRWSVSGAERRADFSLEPIEE